MKIDDLKLEIEKDSVIEETKLDSESLNISRLHAKYNRYYADEMMRLKSYQYDYYSTKKERMEYYLGKADDEVYIKEPLDYKVLKTDVDVYLNADEVLQDAQYKVDVQKLKVDMIENFVKSLTNRGFNIKTALDFMKFKNGEY